MPSLSIGLGIGSQQAVSGGGGATGPTWDTAFNAASYTFSNSNKTATQTGAADQATRSTQSRALSGSHNFAVTIGTKATSFVEIGIADTTMTTANAIGPGVPSIGYLSNGSIQFNSTVIASSLPTLTTGDIVTCYMIGTLVGFAKNGTPVNSFNTSTGAGGTDVSASGSPITTAFPAASGNGAGNVFTGDFTNW